MTAQVATPTTLKGICTDWATACEVQCGFMPRWLPEIDGLSYSAHCRQAQELGGDCYDFLGLSHKRVAFAVGDACGKGLPAALVIANVQSSLRTAVSLSGGDGEVVLRAVNRQVHASAMDGRFVPLFYGVFDAATRLLHFVNAGHNPPMVLRRDGSVEWLEACNVPLGILEDSSYSEGVVQLHPGDLIVAYTDGVTEARNSEGEEWGVEGLLRTAATNLERSADDIVDAVFSSVDDFTRGQRADDATVAVVRIH